ncbi:hypothetical protein QEG73_22000 [Chitinophagaceae bacterium 26-R-25]|nr:hypothetical protein [Chitinophagaceae bacterium 26-R-25]
MIHPTVKYYTINIPTKPYLKKYLVAKYGSPVELNYNTLLGSSVLLALSKTIPSDTSDFKKDIRYRSFSELVWFKIPKSQVNSYRHGLNISRTHIIALNRYFELEFEEYMFNFCNFEMMKRNLPTRKKALELFAENIGLEIEEDITFECLKKTDYRTSLKFKGFPDSFVPKGIYAVQPSLF